MANFQPAPAPTSELGRYRLLSPSCGLRVSPLCLGGMSFGNKWALGEMTVEQSFDMMDTYYDSGGNFIDTSNNYHDGQAEEWVGNWVESRGNREEMVLATKFTMPSSAEPKIRCNVAGNHRKSIRFSVDSSLKRLKTEYLDILYLHWWDFTTPIEEIMQTLDALVKSGKVLYLGISDTPAWIVSQANQYARDHGLAPFVVYQGCWNMITRDLERDIVPMCRANGMGLVVWNAVGGGKFQSKKDLAARKAAGEGLRQLFNDPAQTADQVNASAALEKVATELGTDSVTAVALAWVLHKAPYTFPVVGGRKVSQLKGNIEALTLKLSPAQVKDLDNVKAFEPGFPHDMIGSDPKTNGGAVNFLMAVSGNYSFVPAEQAITLE